MRLRKWQNAHLQLYSITGFQNLSDSLSTLYPSSCTHGSVNKWVPQIVPFRHSHFPLNPWLSSWWLHQPIWKICSSNWIISPIFGVKIPKIFETTTKRYLWERDRYLWRLHAAYKNHIKSESSHHLIRPFLSSYRVVKGVGGFKGRGFPNIP